jgi:hypothetical protein
MMKMPAVRWMFLLGIEKMFIMLMILSHGSFLDEMVDYVYLRLKIKIKMAILGDMVECFVLIKIIKMMF